MWLFQHCQQSHSSAGDMVPTGGTLSTDIDLNNQPNKKQTNKQLQNTLPSSDISKGGHCTLFPV
jgi:hypothetical protein